MDRILVFDNGKIIEDGMHDQLIQLNGRYAAMWQMQTGGALSETLNQFGGNDHFIVSPEFNINDTFKSLNFLVKTNANDS
jgi:hypothetical protein